jgi:glucose/arabinose dehydrogenase
VATGLILLFLLAACGHRAELTVADGMGPNPTLPPPPGFRLLPTLNVARATGWPEGRAPDPAPGLAVSAFARNLDHPRWLYVLPNGDVLVAETNRPPEGDPEGLRGWFMQRMLKRAGAAVPSADRITLLRDRDGDGTAEVRETFLEGLNSPFGMTLVGNALYVANTDAVLRFPYRPGDTTITAPGVKVAELPGGAINYHWTKNLVADPDGQLYVAVGSNSNIAENGMDREHHRAAILRLDPDVGEVEVLASGLRNPVGMDWEPNSGTLWTVVNERDGLGSDLVPDYLTRVVEGAFYGWPYSYFGDHVDERVEPQRPEKVARARKPDYALGPHTASLGLAFYPRIPAPQTPPPDALPPHLRNGAFVGQHGSWNRRPRSGYRVIFVPFDDGSPAGPALEVLGGFLDGDQALGRPVGIVVDSRGALLVADDVGNVVWRVTASSRRRQP